jgi:uncharacterized protein YqgC (DUF456 family)
MENIALIVICSLLMLVGFLGIVLPFIPGVPLIWLGIFIYAIFTGFESISILAVVVFFILMALTLVLDFAGPLFGLKRYKASGWSMAGSLFGFIIGVIFFNIWGAILGPIIGAFAAEILVKKDIRKGSRAAFGAFIGTILGAIIKLVIALVMIGYFIFSFF